MVNRFFRFGCAFLVATTVDVAISFYIIIYCRYTTCGSLFFSNVASKIIYDDLDRINRKIFRSSHRLRCHRLFTPVGSIHKACVRT